MQRKTKYCSVMVINHLISVQYFSESSYCDLQVRFVGRGPYKLMFRSGEFSNMTQENT